ncbi:MAG: hypothetical protein ACFFCM_13475, partial [Promethearchaeota archaeon]
NYWKKLKVLKRESSIIIQRIEKISILDYEDLFLKLINKLIVSRYIEISIHNRFERVILKLSKWDLDNIFHSFLKN